ncbi:MAG: type VI secretion system baseplate subunit TssG [Pseudomonadota bacterium]
MGTDERPPAGALIDRLLSRPQGFNLFQAISLLERAATHADPVGDGATRPEAVRLSAVVSLGFQPSDVSSVVAGSPTGEAFTLRSPVMSLAGAQGPLPMPFTELVLERRAARDHATADFLDIFNHRLLAFLYRGRKKHHMGLNWSSPEESSIAASLDSLSAIGLKSGARGEHGETAWLRHAGLLGPAPRSITGLFAMLGDRLGLRVKGSQFQGAWQEIEPREQIRLGRRSGASRLGRSAVLGRKAWYQSAGIRLELADLTMARLRQFLPGAREHSLMRWLVSRYVQQEMHVELVLTPAVREVRRTTLGAAGEMRLGWTSWLATAPLARATPQPARVRLAVGTHLAATH